MKVLTLSIIATSSAFRINLPRGWVLVFTNNLCTPSYIVGYEVIVAVNTSTTFLYFFKFFLAFLMLYFLPTIFLLAKILHVIINKTIKATKPIMDYIPLRIHQLQVILVKLVY